MAEAGLIMPEWYPYLFILFKGALVTIEISALALVFSVRHRRASSACSRPTGPGLAFTLTRLYVELIRSIPLLVLIFFAYYAIPVVT